MVWTFFVHLLFNEIDEKPFFFWYFVFSLKDLCILFFFLYFLYIRSDYLNMDGQLKKEKKCLGSFEFFFILLHFLKYVKRRDTFAYKLFCCLYIIFLHNILAVEIGFLKKMFRCVLYFVVEIHPNRLEISLVIVITM